MKSYTIAAKPIARDFDELVAAFFDGAVSSVFGRIGVTIEQHRAAIDYFDWRTGRRAMATSSKA